jgi:hypothetical protein
VSVSFAKVRGRIRGRIRDADARHEAFPSPEVDIAIAEAFLTLSAQLPPATLYTASAFTIGANSDTFTLPITVTSSGYGTGTTEYAGDVRIQLANTPNLFLRKMTPAELDAFRNGVTLSPGFYTVPEMFSLYEDSSQVIRGRCYPGAKEAQPCNLWATLKAEDLRDYVGTGGAEGLDTATVLFSREASNALVLYVASDLLKRMTADDVAARKLNPAVADDWRAEAEVLLYQDAANRHAFESSGRTQRWVG